MRIGGKTLKVTTGIRTNERQDKGTKISTPRVIKNSLRILALQDERVGKEPPAVRGEVWKGGGVSRVGSDGIGHFGGGRIGSKSLYLRPGYDILQFNLESPSQEGIHRGDSRLYVWENVCNLTSWKAKIKIVKPGDM